MSRVDFPAPDRPTRTAVAPFGSRVRRRSVDAAEGFEGFELLRPRFGEDRYFVITRWDTREHYDAWVAGRDTSAHADDERRGMSIELLGFEVVQHDE